MGGYTALAETLRGRTPAELCQLVADSGLRGRGGAGFPTGMKWKAIPESAPYPRYVVANSDEMEPGTFKDRVLVNADPHLVIEGMILAAYAVSAREGFFYVRPSYEKDAQLMEREVEAARRAGLLGKNILGSDFSFDITVHRSGGRYICGEVSALLQAIHGRRPNPKKIPGIYETQIGLWGKPTLINNAETLACVAPIIKNGPQWFKGLARTEAGIGNKLFCVSGRVRRPGCYELPMGTPLSEIIEDAAGGMPEGMEFKACLPGGASTRLSAERTLSCADGLRFAEKSRQPPGDQRHHGLRPEHLPGGGHPQSDGFFRAGVLRLVHPLPGRVAVPAPSALADRERRRTGRAHRHAARPWPRRRSTPIAPLPWVPPNRCMACWTISKRKSGNTSGKKACPFR